MFSINYKTVLKNIQFIASNEAADQPNYKSIEVAYSLKMDQSSSQAGNLSESREISPKELSGDENDEGSIITTMIPANKANFMLSITIIIKSIIGAGIISLPYTMSRLGYIFTIIIFLIFGTLNQVCCSLLLRAKNLSGHSNYSTIMGYIWGGNLSKFFGSLIIFLDNFGTCVLELIILKASIRKIISDFVNDDGVMNQFYCSELFLVIVLAIMELPLILVKKIENLRFFSFIGVAGIIIFIISVVIHFIIKVTEGYDSVPLRAFPEDWYEAFAVMPNIILAFDYQMNFFPIYKGLRNATDRKMNIASIVGLSSCAASYMLIGMIGYSLSGHDVQANFLESIPYNGTNTALFLIINFCFLLSITCAYALMFFGCRNNFIAILNLMKNSLAKKDHYQKADSDGVISQSLYQQGSSSKLEKQKRKNIQFYVSTMLIHIAVSTIAVFLNNIEDILNLIGAICQNLIAIILPCLFYCMLIRKQQKHRKFMFYFTIVVISIIAPYGIFTIVANYI